VNEKFKFNLLSCDSCQVQQSTKSHVSELERTLSNLVSNIHASAAQKQVKKENKNASLLPRLRLAVGTRLRYVFLPSFILSTANLFEVENEPHVSLNDSNNLLILTTFNEIDMSALVSMRKKYKDAVQKEHNVKLDCELITTIILLLLVRLFLYLTIVNLGKWVLRNLFIGFVLEEQRRHSQDEASQPSITVIQIL
jgi:hypothetical protein